MSELHIACKLALEKYGKDLQILVAIEELAELTKELSQYRRENKFNIEHLAEEIADVEIMLVQIKLMYNLEALVMKLKHDKIERLFKRLGVKFDG